MDDGSATSKSKFGFWDKISMLFSHPTAFFEKIKTEDMSGAIVTYLIVGAFFVGISSLSFLFFPLLAMPIRQFTPFAYFIPFGWMFISAIIFVLGFGWTFVSAGILHVFARLFGGTGTYSDSYKAKTYSAVPYFLLALVPFVGVLVGWIYSIVLTILGISALHKLSGIKATIAVLLLPVVMLLILAGMFLSFLSLIF